LREQLQLLEQLQEIDSQVDRWESDLTRLPLEVQDLARNLVVSRREIAESRERLTALEKDLKKREQDLASEQEKIKRSERRLLGIKNQKEYNALSREVKLGKKVVGELEEAILGLMTETEGIRRSLERREREYEETEKTMLEKKHEAETSTTTAKGALVSLTSEKEKITEAIDREFLKKYQTVKRVRGNALAEMHNGSCTGCHMTIPAQLAIRVLKQEEMIICPNCNRILYVKPENIPEFNKLEA
jgi:uncharacterized protein